MAYKLNKFATLCQEDDVVDIDINMEPTEGEEVEAIDAEIEANEAVAEVNSAMDQLDNAETAADEVEERIEEGEAVIAVSEPAVDNGGEVPADVVVTTDSGKELTEEEVAEAVEKLNEAGEVAPEVVVEQEAFIQRIELITGLKRRNPGIALESARRNSTDSYKLCQEGLSEIGASIKEFIMKIWEWITTQVKKIVEFIKKYLPTKAGKARRLIPELEKKKDKKVAIKEISVADAIYIGMFTPEVVRSYDGLASDSEAVLKDLEKVVNSFDTDTMSADENKVEGLINSAQTLLSNTMDKYTLRLKEGGFGSIAAKKNKTAEDTVKSELKKRGYKDSDKFSIQTVSPDLNGKDIANATATATVLVLVKKKDGDKELFDEKTETITVKYKVDLIELTAKDVVDVLNIALNMCDKEANVLSKLNNISKQVIDKATKVINDMATKSQAVSDAKTSYNVRKKEIQATIKASVKAVKEIIKGQIATTSAISSRLINVYGKLGGTLIKK